MQSKNIDSNFSLQRRGWVWRFKWDLGHGVGVDKKVAIGRQPPKNSHQIFTFQMDALSRSGGVRILSASYATAN